ncbi:MAG: hypothetical protein EBX52_13100 [Proteobacteria bacterium]|nr:hypothetical protein [Pseudomonadota bacterium]
MYEKVRIREHKKRFWTIALAITLFISLCAVPVIEERLPKWRGLGAARSLSLVLEHLKTNAIREKKPLRIRFTEEGLYQIEVLNGCRDANPIRLLEKSAWTGNSGLKVLSASDLSRLPVALAVDSICFDPVYGLDGVKTRQVLVVVPVNDLSDSRLDRASYVVLEGESAKISIN